MSTLILRGAIFTLGDTYTFEGVIFEWHPYLGPSLCKKDGELSKRIFSAKEYDKIQRWMKLTKKQKTKTRWEPTTASPKKRKASTKS